VKVEIQFANLQNVRDMLGRIPQAVKEACTQTLEQAAEEIMTRAKELCPVDTGALRASGHVQAPVDDAGGVSVELGFGGPAAPYAVYVHENLDAHHTVGQAKFLEDPLMQDVNEIQSDLNQAVREGLAKAGFKN
jgi:hypothetical protein